jgi:hypothetical protein
MQFAECPICHLNLPRNILVPIIVKHQGKIMTVLICERCKKNKEEESTRRKNEIN